MRIAKVGVFPLYLKLCDDAMPELRPGCESYLESVARGFESKGLEVCRACLCRLESEMRPAFHQFHVDDVDLPIPLHATYSPSLEAVEPLLARSNLVGLGLCKRLARDEYRTLVLSRRFEDVVVCGRYLGVETETIL